MDKIFSIKNLFIFIIIAIIFLFLKDDGIIDYQTLVTQHNQLLIEIYSEQSNIMFLNIFEKKYYYNFTASKTEKNFTY